MDLGIHTLEIEYYNVFLVCTRNPEYDQGLRGMGFTSGIGIKTGGYTDIGPHMYTPKHAFIVAFPIPPYVAEAIYERIFHV